jgi:multiple sugar transport system substrate-binding protein
MKRTRRGLLVTALSAAVGLVIAACSSSGGGSSNGAVTLSFWNGLTGPDRPAVEHLVSAFNKSHPKIHITMQIMPWDVFYQKLLPAFGAHKGPALVGMDSNQIPVYASKHVLQPIDSIFGSGGVQKSSIVGPALSAGEYQGKIYGVPIENTPLLLYYNKKMFSAAGLDPSKPPTNWSEWAADAKKLTTGSGPGGKPTHYGMAIGVHDTVELMPILMMEADGGILSSDGKRVLLNNSGSKQAVQYWANLVHNNQISPVGLSGGDADKLIQSGTAAMEVNGPWATTGYKQAGIDYGLAPVPTGPNGQHITLGNTTCLAASSALNSSQLQAVGEFYKYWAQKESQTYFALHTGFPPVTTDVPLSSLSSNPDVAAFAQHASEARGLAPGQANFAQIQAEVFDPAMEKIFNNPASTSSELDSAAKQVQSLISSGG